MIHSPGGMPTGNLDESAHAPSPGVEPERSFRLPAEYYSAPLSEVSPILPKWVPWGCGLAAVLFLAVLFAGGALLTGPRLAAAIDLVLGMTVGELKGMYTPEVTDAQKSAFDASVEQMREKLRTDAISVQHVQPFMQETQKAMRDRKLTPEETERLTAIAGRAAKGAEAGTE